jgi:hypothetical protein
MGRGGAVGIIRLLALMFPVKVEGKKARLLGRFAKQSDRLELHRAGGGAQRRRLIRLSSGYGHLFPSETHADAMDRIADQLYAN